MPTNQPKAPVPVLIQPRFDAEGEPTCCVWSNELDDLDVCPLRGTTQTCELQTSYGSDKPGPECPIHSPEAREKPL